MTRRVIRTDGTETMLDRPVSFDEICSLIGAVGLDTVALRHLGDPLQVMLVDDLGHVHGRKPVNPKATALYHANCVPGTTHEIVGDVAIIFDDDEPAA
jgi:hypothetical protein